MIPLILKIVTVCGQGYFPLIGLPYKANLQGKLFFYQVQQTLLYSSLPQTPCIVLLGRTYTLGLVFIQISAGMPNQTLQWLKFLIYLLGIPLISSHSTINS